MEQTHRGDPPPFLEHPARSGIGDLDQSSTVRSSSNSNALREMPRAGMIRQAEVIIVLETRAGLKIAPRRRRVCESTSGPAAPGPQRPIMGRWRAAPKPLRICAKKTFRDGHTLPGFAMLLQLSDYIALQT
ncbi:hypothetical protein LB579_34990 [Mesorhizobium sp. BR1-1-7]|uniref:hypothetical protein n=1 Tax=Mesorhizobium sp. BR1-1-7 TaxID=2876647 RepID=UPI001CCC4032|nr:hypothetical protein [Mesorhizobium sp. BR1-1-7]MBZ9922860.1 hypothetical protein [Mesorhizobium sp. BR1-1-7]